MAIAKDMLNVHPVIGQLDSDALAACIRHCFDAAQACTACADACLSEPDARDLTTCVRLNLNAADICIATGRVLSRIGEADLGVLHSQVQACAVVCQACARAYEHHQHHSHCQVCARACRGCEQACLVMLEQLSRV